MAAIKTFKCSIFYKLLMERIHITLHYKCWYKEGDSIFVVTFILVIYYSGKNRKQISEIWLAQNIQSILFDGFLKATFKGVAPSKGVFAYWLIF